MQIKPSRPQNTPKTSRRLGMLCRQKALLLSVTLLLSPQNSRASQTDEQEPAAIALEEGSAAPFSGILLPFGRASKLYQRIELCEKERVLERTHFEDTLAIEQGLRAEQVATLQAALAKAEAAAKREWYEDKGLLLGTGVVAGVLAGIGMLWLSAQVRIEVPVRE